MNANLVRADLSMLERFAMNNERETQNGVGVNINDSGTDTFCFGKGWKIVEETERTCTIHGFDKDMKIENKPICTAITAYDHPSNGNTYILKVHEGIDLGRKQANSLICPNQLRAYGLEVDDIPKFLTRGKSIHGIRIDENLILPYELQGRTSFLRTREPTEEELQ